MTESSLWSLLLVMAVAAVAPIISRLVPGRPPQVLFLIIGGVIIGPHVLGRPGQRNPGQRLTRRERP